MDEPFQEQIWLSKSVELSQISINLLTQYKRASAYFEGIDEEEILKKHMMYGTLDTSNRYRLYSIIKMMFCLLLMLFS